MPVKVQALYVHNITKIYAFWVNELIDEWNTELQTEFVKVTEVMKEKMGMFTRSTDLEVQERVCDSLIYEWCSNLCIITRPAMHGPFSTSC